MDNSDSYKLGLAEGAGFIMSLLDRFHVPYDRISQLTVEDFARDEDDVPGTVQYLMHSAAKSGSTAKVIELASEFGDDYDTRLHLWCLAKDAGFPEVTKEEKQTVAKLLPTNDAELELLQQWLPLIRAAGAKPKITIEDIEEQGVELLDALEEPGAEARATTLIDLLLGLYRAQSIKMIFPGLELSSLTYQIIKTRGVDSVTYTAGFRDIIESALGLLTKAVLRW